METSIRNWTRNKTAKQSLVTTVVDLQAVRRIFGSWFQYNTKEALSSHA